MTQKQPRQETAGAFCAPNEHREFCRFENRGKRKLKFEQCKERK
nr:MAG TPA: hypothetical protein [Caudoviricetes sp.]